VGVDRQETVGHAARNPSGQNGSELFLLERCGGGVNVGRKASLGDEKRKKGRNELNDLVCGGVWQSTFHVEHSRNAGDLSRGDAGVKWPLSAPILVIHADIVSAESRPSFGSA
jgi:hypothetical protein